MNPVHSDSKNRARFANAARSACAKGTTAFRAERNLAAVARNQPFDALVAGAGIWGCTVARRLAEAGRRVLVLEKRKAVGGNCRCKTINGIEVHLYGSHIFHTSNEAVWQFVNRFTAFNDYRHCVLANYRGKVYHLPIGKTLAEEFFGVDLSREDLKTFLSRTSDLNSTNRTNGDDLFDAFIRGYTSKQWGVPPEKVDPSIIARLKVRDNYSTDYFDDPHQGIPAEGYNKFFANMLDHPNITVRTSSSLKLEKGRFVVFDEKKKCGIPLSNSNSKLELYYSGPIDALFGYKFGALPWRSLRFETETLPVRDFQHNSVVNYTEASVPYTRIHEFKHYHPESKGILPLSNPNSKLGLSMTIITREYPADWQKGDEPYYPIATAESAALLARYQEEVARFNSSTLQPFNLIIGGRLGAFKYYDMDKSIAAALEVEI